MKTAFTILLYLLIHSLLFWGCEDPSLEGFVVNEHKESNLQASEERQKLICYLGRPQPEFPGGLKALFEFLASNIEYPLQPLNEGVDGTVYVGFFVNKDGTLSDFCVKRVVHPDLDAEALRVLKLMPNWSWESYKGSEIPEKILFTMPVKFKLN